jgi:hypothetical protein
VKLNKLVWPLACVVSFLGAPPASAQPFGTLLDVEIPFDISRGRNVSVQERQRPETDPLGLNQGAFLIYPKLEAGLGYTNNVYGSATNKVSDAYFTITPSVNIRSQWSRHSLHLMAEGDFRRFAQETLRNEDGYAFAADGRLDVYGDSNVYAQVKYQKDYEQQYSGSFPANAAQSVPFQRAIGTVRGTWQVNRMRLIGNLDLNNLKYQDTLSVSGTLLDQNYRDRSIYRGSTRLEYALNPDAAAFVQLTYAKSAYDRARAGFGERDSNEVRALGGMTFDLTALIRGSVGVGYVRRNYADARFGTAQGIATDLRIEYFPSGLTTISLSARRAIEDAILTDSAGFILTSAKIRVDHELLRNLLLYTQFDYEHDAFQEVLRRDNLFQYRLGGDYMISRNIRLAPEVSYIKRTSHGTPVGQAFDEARAYLLLSLQI